MRRYSVQVNACWVLVWCLGRGRHPSTLTAAAACAVLVAFRSPHDYAVVGCICGVKDMYVLCIAQKRKISRCNLVLCTSYQSRLQSAPDDNLEYYYLYPFVVLTRNFELCKVITGAVDNMKQSSCALELSGCAKGPDKFTGANGARGRVISSLKNILKAAVVRAVLFLLEPSEVANFFRDF